MFDKNDVYRVFYEKLSEVNDWIYDCEGKDAEKACSYVSGLCEMVESLLKYIDRRENDNAND